MANFSSADNGYGSSSPSSDKIFAPMAALITLFFMWGFITSMNDILIPYLKGVFELSFVKATLVQFAFFGAYFIGSLIYFLLSVRSGDPIAKIGYKNGMLAGLLTATLGCLLFFPAAHFKMYGFFLGALFVLGLGLTILQITANPYVSLLGRPETAPSRLNLAQGFNSLGTTLAPLIGGFLIFEYFANDDTIFGADAVKIPYLFMALFFGLLAVLIYFTRLPHVVNSDLIPQNAGALNFRHLVLGIVAVFMYVGAEVSIGSFLISFFELGNIAALQETSGKSYLSFYWGGAMIGRFAGAIALSSMQRTLSRLGFMSMTAIGVTAILFLIVIGFEKMVFQDTIYFVFLVLLNLLAFLVSAAKPGRMVGIFAVMAIALLSVAILANGKLAMWAVIGVGLFNSIMWSTIFTLAIRQLGVYTAQGSSLLVMAILGGALVPMLQGSIADGVSVQHSFIVPLFCYIYIAYYGFAGSKIKES